ncbi:MAG TPA: hypothetical protein VF331_02395 [Polyangiales bacterium]
MPYPPFISPRSPSYERSIWERKHPTFTGDPEVIALFARLSEAEENAREACAKVAQRLTDDIVGAQVRDGAEMHRTRRAALAELIEALGGSAPRLEECRELLPHAAQAIASAEYDSRAAMTALGVMRTELSAAYAEAFRSPCLDAAQRASLVELAPFASDAS